jgi:UDP-4-amino-4,6-dideoxy-N-acetyl-beta-L-altrosamine N-acetyltransferase
LNKQKLICARRMHERDLEIVLHWRNHPAVRRNMLTQHEITIAEHRLWFERLEKDDTYALLVIEEDNQAIGCVVFSNVSFQGSADWSFYANPDSIPGTGLKVCTAALDVAFQELKVHKVAGQVLSFNKASTRTHLQLGFAQEGTFREHRLINGEYCDLLCFGILESEWQLQQQSGARSG